MHSATRSDRAAGLAAVAALLACAQPPQGGGAPYSPELQRFAAAVGTARPTPGRLTGGFGHAPFGVEDAAGDRVAQGVLSTAPRTAPLDRGAARLALRVLGARTGGTPEELAAAGVVALVGGRSGDAVDLLELAAARAPSGDPRYLVDLANSYLGRGLAEDDPLDWVLAAETAGRAVELDGGLPEALFTHAAALEVIGLGAEAAGAWRRLLAVEAHGDWADEARRRVEGLERSPVQGAEAALLAAADRGDPGALRRLVEDRRERARELGEELLGEWAAAAGSVDHAAAVRLLGRARAFGHALAELGGDRLLADSVAAIDRTWEAPMDTTRQRRLVAGHRSHAAGRRADAQYDAESAREQFAAAERDLEEAGSPFAARSRVWRAVQALRLSRWEETFDASAGLIDAPGAAAAHPTLTARAGWVRGLALTVAGSPSAARDDYEAALAASERAGEPGVSTYLRGLLAETSWFIGDRRAAWGQWIPVLRDFDRIDEARRRHALADGMADELADLGRPRVELCLRDRLVALHEAEGTALDRGHARLKRSRTLLRLGRQEEARRDLAVAESLVPEIAGEEVRELVRIDLLVSRAHLTGDDPASAAADLGEAIDHYRSRSRAFPLTQLHFARAALHRRLGDRAAAEADLRAAIAALESQRSEIRGTLDRGVFFARAEAIFGGLVSLLAEQPGREAEALMVAEQGRARTLLDLALRTSGGASADLLDAVAPQPVPSLERILAALPEDREAVVYSVLEDEALAWILRRSGVEMLRLETSLAELAPLALELVRAAASGGPTGEVAALGERLSERIYRPVARRLTSDGTLLVVPDGPLLGVPFALLGGEEPGRFLVEERAVAILPSASLLAEVGGRHRTARSAGLPPLIVGPPGADGAASALPPLRAAAREAVRIAALYPGTERIAGAEATEEALLRGLAERDLVHFAGHAVPDPRDPLRSALILSGGGSGRQQDGRLEAVEILAHRFEHAPRVVLAACATHDHAGRPETGVTLATALLAAGAGGVVATLWPVEDEVTSEMMVELHQELAGGAGVAEAMAVVQRRAREGSGELGSAADWGAWIVFATQ
jgi:CHAT domain-containing protein